MSRLPILLGRTFSLFLYHCCQITSSIFFFTCSTEQDCKLNVNHTCIEIQNKRCRQTHEGIQKYEKYFIFLFILCQYILKSTNNSPCEVLKLKVLKVALLHVFIMYDVLKSNKMIKIACFSSSKLVDLLWLYCVLPRL